MGGLLFAESTAHDPASHRVIRADNKVHWSFLSQTTSRNRTGVPQAQVGRVHTLE